MKKGLELTSTQRKLHQVDAVMAVVSEKGDGYITNEPGNLQLAGMLVRHRDDQVPSRAPHHYEMISLDSALVQIDLIGASIGTEADRINGDVSGVQQPISGELSELEKRRRRILANVSLTTEQQDDLTNFFRGVAKPRTLATHPLNIDAWTEAVRTQTLSMGAMNPTEIAQMVQHTAVLRTALNKRYARVQGTKARNYILDYYQTISVNNENNRLAKANEYLDILIDDPGHPVKADLDDLSRKILYRVQPFNYLAKQLNYQDDRDDPKPYILARQGIFMKRFTNHLLQPIRNLRTIKGVHLASLDVDQTTADVTNRLELFENFELGGAYKTLRNRFLAAGAALLAAVESRQITAVHGKAHEMKYRMEHHCLPNELSEIDNWYGHRPKHR